MLYNLERGKSNIDKFNESAEPLLKSHLETYVTNQLRHLNSRYEVSLKILLSYFFIFIIFFLSINC